LNQDSDTPAGDGHPLAGVLDRLLARERGTFVAAADPSRNKRPETLESREAAPVLAPAARRMLVVAALGSDAGAGVLRQLARWALDAGRHPAVLDIGNSNGLELLGSGTEPVPDSRGRVPLANLPSTLENLKDQPAEILAASLERLRRHESLSDLLLVRVPPDYRMALMRAAFLAGGLVVPVEDSPEVLHEALRISRELAESFLDVALWPFPCDAAALERYRTLMFEFLGAETTSPDLEPARAGDVLNRLSAPPREGFLVSLIDPDTPSPPAQLLQIGTLRL